MEETDVFLYILKMQQYQCRDVETKREMSLFVECMHNQMEWEGKKEGFFYAAEATCHHSNNFYLKKHYCSDSFSKQRRITLLKLFPCNWNLIQVDAIMVNGIAGLLDPRTH